MRYIAIAIISLLLAASLQAKKKPRRRGPRALNDSTETTVVARELKLPRDSVKTLKQRYGVGQRAIYMACRLARKAGVTPDSVLALKTTEPNSWRTVCQMLGLDNAMPADSLLDKKMQRRLRSRAGIKKERNPGK